MQNAQKKFDKGDIVNHSIWNAGKILEVDEDKREYSIEFFEKNIIRPINFGFSGLTKIEVKTSDESLSKTASFSDPSISNIQENLIVTAFDDTIESNAEILVPTAIEQNGNADIIEKGILELISEFAKKEYPENIEMQAYIYNEQIIALNYMESVKDLELKKFAIREYPKNYALQQYTYDEQVRAKAYMLTVNDSELKEFTQHEYPDNYSMQQYIYDNQVASKAYMQTVPNNRIKAIAQNEYPQNYDMQKYIYDNFTN